MRKTWVNLLQPNGRRWWRLGQKRLVLTISLAGALLAFATVLIAAPSQDPRIPRRYANARGQIVWISAEEYVATEAARSPGAAAGEPDQFTWIASEIARLRTAGSAKAPGECDYSFHLDVPEIGANLDFDTLARAMPTIVRGTVVASGDGLLDGQPLTLLLVNVDRWIKRGESVSETTEVFVLYRSPTVRIGGVTVCRPKMERPPAPAVGTTILLSNNTETTVPPTLVGGVPVLYSGDLLIYDGIVDGRLALMASDRLLRDSPDWIQNATVESLDRRLTRILGLGGAR